ncbi:MAG: hypothetical protein OEW58_09365 [Gammaproteobacteria bacterium]|nr:hypothetical protein [Gammaproteobacteria bacterium]
MSEQAIAKLQQLQEKQTSIKVSIGVTIGIIFLIYFFTFAMLVDKFPPIFFYIEAITSVIFLIMLFKLNKASFCFMGSKIKKAAAEFPELAKYRANDVDTKPEKLLGELKTR